MRKVLYILGDLADKDVDWLVSAGGRQVCRAGTVIIHEGQQADSLYLILDGRFHVNTRALGDRPIAVLGSGEIVGEVSFLDARPTTATVRAVSDALVFRLSQADVKAKLAGDPAFAARFYRALAAFLANRLRNTVAKLGAGHAPAEDGEDADEIDPDLLDSVGLAAARFDWMLNRLKGA